MGVVIVAVKKYCKKGGKTYGPYPKNPEIFYLYRVEKRGDRVISVYLGKGPKPDKAIGMEMKKTDEERLAKYPRIPRKQAVPADDVVQENKDKGVLCKKMRENIKRSMIVRSSRIMFLEAWAREDSFAKP